MKSYLAEVILREIGSDKGGKYEKDNEGNI